MKVGKRLGVRPPRAVHGRSVLRLSQRIKERLQLIVDVTSCRISAPGADRFSACRSIPLAD
jgi:hypothetical protein